MRRQSMAMSVERKMLCRKVAAVFSICFLVLVNGMPQESHNGQETGGLPLIQFTNGGIRFNFGGYHAEAGLGGLLGGSKAGGGLHASAGTPWGANAAAGLGGLLGGDNANAGGGLYARAGLGNGRPEASAGLGGTLDGSGRPSARGGLFAGATTGVHGVATGIGSGGPNVIGEQSGPNNKDNEDRKADGKTDASRANIQIISKKPGKVKQVVTVVEGSTEVPRQADPPAHKYSRDIQPSQSVPDASIGTFDSASLSAVPPATVTRTVQKIKIIGGGIEQAPAVQALPNDVNELVNDNRPQRVRIVYPKRVVRKRFWGPRKQIVYESSVETQDAPSSNIQKRQAYDIPAKAPAPRDDMQTRPNSNNGFYDDIFQIPISTLNAVKQLLNNNSG